MSSNVKFIDLFCGLGGFRIALENLGGTCVYSSDNDKYVQDIYNLNFGEIPDGDITKVSPKEVPDHDILCAGFPCQPFSIGGLRKGFLDTRGTLFFDIERILRAKKPKSFILENVKGLTNHDEGRTLETILRTLAKTVNGKPYDHEGNLGYDVYYKVLNTKDFGIPQNRERIYIIGIKNSKKTFEFPATSSNSMGLDILLSKTTNKEEYRVSTNVCSQILHHLDLKKDRYSTLMDEPLIAYEVRPSRCSFRQDGASPTLTAKMGTGGNNVPIYVQEMRKLTLRECLDLQGFPDNYVFPDRGMQSYKQIGNSLTVPVVEAIASKLIPVI